jgi:hypothetical protein
VVQVLHRVRLYIDILLLQAVKVSRSVVTPLPFQHTDVLMGVALVWAEQEEIGFARTLGIRQHNFRRDRRLHDGPSSRRCGRDYPGHV